LAHDVFVSHSAKDKTVADAVCATLEGAGIRCWVAPRDILPSADWGESIIEAIEGARLMILIFSSHSNESDQVKREIQNAVQEGLAILPLRIEDVPLTKSLRYFLGPVHWLDALTPPLESHLTAMVPKVRALLGHAAGEPSASPPPPTQSGSFSAPAVKEVPPAKPLQGRTNSLGNRLVPIPRELRPPAFADRPAWVSATCVSNAEYMKFVLDGGSPPTTRLPKGSPRVWKAIHSPTGVLEHPVLYVVHSQALQFCQWLTRRERQEGAIQADEQYVLPTLEMWKALAAHARLTDEAALDRTWPNEWSQPTSPVDSGTPTSLGLHHWYGNVFEWCQERRNLRVRNSKGEVRVLPGSPAIGGGWASGRQWLGEQIRAGNHGTIWGPEPWPMKDGGFRLWLVKQAQESAPR